MPIDALNVLCAQLMRNLFAIAKFLLGILVICIANKLMHKTIYVKYICCPFY